MLKLIPRLVFTLLILVACSPAPSSTPVTESNPDKAVSSIEGLWKGQVKDNIGGGDVELMITEEDNSLNGELRLSFSAGLVRHTAKGTLSGTIEGKTVIMLLTPSDERYCPYQAFATLANESLSGSYKGVACQDVIVGTLELTKQ